MRSESCTASVMLWVISSVVCRSSCWICSTLSPSSSRVCSSSAANGSSISRMRGRAASVRAMQTRWRIPPDSSDGCRRSKPRRPTMSMKRLARSCRSDFGDARQFQREGRRCPARCARGSRTPPGTPCRPPGAGPVIGGTLHQRRWPLVAASSPPMMLNRVDLPQPDGPMTETNSPGATSNETSSTATTPSATLPKRLVTRSTASTGGTAATAAGRSAVAAALTCRAGSARRPWRGCSPAPPAHRSRPPHRPRPRRWPRRTRPAVRRHVVHRAEARSAPCARASPARSSSGSVMRWPIHLFSTGRPRSRATCAPGVPRR